jgi:hypothetical protein
LAPYRGLLLKATTFGGGCLLSKKETFDNGVELLLEMYGLWHDKRVYNNSEKTIYNKL